MRYKTAAAFRRALEERLRQQSLEGRQALARLRKMVAFDRFLARLARREPEAWIVKGGFAIQLRLGDRARTTKDIDVSATKLWTREETVSHLRAAASLDLGDWFEVEVGEPAEAATGAPGRPVTFRMRSSWSKLRSRRHRPRPPACRGIGARTLGARLVDKTILRDQRSCVRNGLFRYACRIRNHAASRG